MKQAKRSRALLVLLGCVAALALCAAAAMALLLRVPAAQDVTIPGVRGGIPATVQMPAKLARAGEVPLVVLCHGFTGDRTANGHFPTLAAKLAELGIATVRMDFAGCGSSTEPYTEYSLASMTDDVNSAIAFLQSEYGVDGAIGLVGHSMGGRLVSLYPQDGQYPVAALALWSPANGAGLQGLEFLNIEDFSVVEALAAEAEANGQAGTKWGVAISAEFVRGMRESDPNAALRACGLPVLLIYSGNEGPISETTQSETIATVESLGEGRVVLEPFVDGNHNFYGADDAATARLDETLCTVTAAFLVQQLK
ncbi:MAG TPA: alpha/beta fold hydrolase [Candidatus Gemmiger excrementipullorum]|uniref:Alpha/beta fold hydrolase n=1 Tax=Candidatus Gemmiger excrementipullorum TaxID=2838610 RepID=A0A9D1Y018_9FIRM|nr:alpha/beta fold hydrolase [Candidatus Gemmiger excrementipullorum]